jgi:hypothetical protein
VAFQSGVSLDRRLSAGGGHIAKHRCRRDCRPTIIA